MVFFTTKSPFILRSTSLAVNPNPFIQRTIISIPRKTAPDLHPLDRNPRNKQYSLAITVLSVIVHT